MNELDKEFLAEDAILRIVVVLFSSSENGNGKVEVTFMKFQ